MLTIIPSHLLQRLHSLEDFDARSCYSVIYLFDFQSLVIAKGETKFLSSLKRIILFDLCEIIQIWNGDATLISLCNLTTISVYHCSKLRQVFPPPLLQSLVSLEIIDCNSLEEIFGKEEEEDQENEIVALKIDHTAVSLEFPALESVNIQECPKLETFVRGGQVAPKLNVIHLEGEKRWMDNLNITVQQFFNEKLSLISVSPEKSTARPVLEGARQKGKKCKEMEEFGQINEDGNSNKGVDKFVAKLLCS
ncbi:hypothetical protein JRO89_XSUnG0132700 [Xanthoceras sorbifolium]|uniref:Disease resistance protein At4g27190-like leucine-rich repeats domain-containing protein n=1 Tax=Xanthoceras sorbifolium TaxID=99658 RepID=A0ABQ8GYM1_9ROSI|nr:hypothetical protein JRO89_XSUnG0132700 [Xanthoceras sorbifolium]